MHQAQPPPPLRNLLRDRRFEDAITQARVLLASDPGNRDVLLCLVIAQRFLQRFTDALETLAILESHHPRFSRLYEQRGCCLMGQREVPRAIEAFRKAVDLNHALPESWKMLQTLYDTLGDTHNLALASSRISALRSLPGEVVLATGLFLDGDIEAAENLIRSFLSSHGEHIEAMRLLARIGIEHKVYIEAEMLLAAVVARAPDYHQAREEYASALAELRRYSEAKAQTEHLLKNEPDNRRLRLLHAGLHVGLGQHERAIELYRALLSGGPQDAEIHIAIGNAQKTIGQSEMAIASYQQAIARRDDCGDAYWSLANLKTYRFSESEIVHMERALAAASTPSVDRCHLHFALGKAYEDRREYATAYDHYTRGNALKHSEYRYQPEIVEQSTAAQIRVCTPEYFATRQDWGNPAPDPIFIIGLPRSGSTLLEQILASHSQVDGTQELPNVPQLVSRLRALVPEGTQGRYPEVLVKLSAEDFRSLGAQYLTETQMYRTDKPFFIDKLPNNFRYVGLIHLMFPRARIIDARREPMACCFSNFKQLFANGQEFAYSVNDLARWYRTYLELMRHWDIALPGRILRVHYEDVVTNLEGSVRRVLEYCGLPFEPQCVAFHQTQRNVHTPSSEQVRQGIFRDGLQQWRHFEPWLTPLKAALGDAVSRYRED